MMPPVTLKDRYWIGFTIAIAYWIGNFTGFAQGYFQWGIWSGVVLGLLGVLISFIGSALIIGRVVYPYAIRF